jgi:WD40 repeat protein
MSYERSYRAYALESTERFLYAGDIGGRLRVIDVDSFTITAELQAHGGVIERMAAHPTLPYFATLCADQTIGIWRHEGATVTRVHLIDLRTIEPENAEDYSFLQTAHSESIALNFHPTERRFLSRNAIGAPCEVVFDDEAWRTSWCHGYPRDGGMSETISIHYLPDGRVAFTTNAGTVRVIRVGDAAQRATPDFEFTSEYGQAIHELCQVDGLVYLAPSDGRHIVRFDFSGKTPPLVGPLITRDDVETISHCPATGRTFATSFDRNVYEIDPETCAAKRIAVRTPFKLRWHSVLKREPSTMIVQCRNGSLYKLDLRRKSVTAALREGPNALWSGVALPGGDVVIAGEGSSVLRLSRNGREPSTEATSYRATWEVTGANPGAYTKRAVYHAPTDTILLGRTDGQLRALGPKGDRLVAELGSPVRDVATNAEGHIAYVATEDGTAHRIDLETSKVTATFRTEEEPIWAIAVNPERHLMAVSERYASLLLVDTRTMKKTGEIKKAPRAKRMKWLDKDTLIFSRSTILYRLNVETGDCTSLIQEVLNTVEDFAWDPERRYFAAIGYHREISLYDMRSFEHFHTTTFDMDYPKGLIWLNDRASGRPSELLVHGRSGVARRYIVHNNVLVPDGVLNEPTKADLTAGVIVP